MTKMASGKSRNSDGERHGRLVAVERVGQDRWKAALWGFRCDCGNENYVARIDQVRRGIVKSCGCLRREASAERASNRTIHGHSGRDKRSSEYRSWRGMLDRCERPTTHNYARYGGRGVTVCERWHDFTNFLADMGKKPSPRHTIERIENNGNYEPGNCRWESAKEQNRNRSDNRLVTYLGWEMTIAEACERTGISRNAVDARLRRGWTPERAVTTPVKYHRPRQR